MMVVTQKSFRTEGSYNNMYTHIEVLHWFGNIELVHSGNDNGWSGKEEEKEEKDAVDDKATRPPWDSSQGQMLPVG